MTPRLHAAALRAADRLTPEHHIRARRTVQRLAADADDIYWKNRTHLPRLIARRREHLEAALEPLIRAANAAIAGDIAHYKTALATHARLRIAWDYLGRHHSGRTDACDLITRAAHTTVDAAEDLLDLIRTSPATADMIAAALKGDA